MDFPGLIVDWKFRSKRKDLGHIVLEKVDKNAWLYAGQNELYWNLKLQRLRVSVLFISCQKRNLRQDIKYIFKKKEKKRKKKKKKRSTRTRKNGCQNHHHKMILYLDSHTQRLKKNADRTTQ